jgi:hypothetical protein
MIALFLELRPNTRSGLGSLAEVVMRKAFCAAAVLLFVGLAGCGGDDDPAPIPVDDLPAEFADAFCAQARACAGEVVDVFFGGIDCETLYTNAFEDAELENLKASIEAGRVVYDSGRAGDCIAALGSLSCSGLANPQPAACEDALRGTIAEGDDCGSDYECEGDGFCDRPAGACPGTCTPRRAAGGECVEDDTCRAGLVCGASTMRCVAPATDGMPCEGGSAPECEPGLVCLGQMTGTPGTCQPNAEVFVGDVGDTCAIEGPLCREGRSCVAISVGAGGAELECQAAVSSGAACKAGVPDQCPEDEWCEGTNLLAGMVDGTCAPLPATGETCAAVLIGQRCADGLVCVAGRNQCLPVGRNGSPCMEGAQCYSGNCVGGACVPNEQCVP